MNEWCACSRQASYSKGTAFPSRGMRLPPHLHLVPRLRIRGAVPPLAIYAFMVGTVPFI